MDSSAIYVDALSDLAFEVSSRWCPALERRAFASELVSNMMQWKWCDFQTGETLAPAIDEPPKLPELSRIPTDSNISWDDIPGEDLEVDLNVVHGANAVDCVLVYQYA
jgi:hypothetical protein